MKLMKKSPEFRPSTLKERKQFYEKEFKIEKVNSWFKKNKMPLPQLCAVDPGTETGIILNKKLKGNLFYFPFNQLKQKIKKYIPEDVYYDRNKYKNPNKTLKTSNFKKFLSQELVFDIDSDNILCKHKKHEQVCNICLNKAYKHALNLKKELKKEFKKVIIAYSGRGFHLHVLDKKAFSLTIKQREQLNKKFSRFPIDPWVSRGYIELIRLPFSLNSLVSRIAIPIENKRKFEKQKTIPKFLRN